MAENYKKSIFDSIHGFIGMTRTEDRIVASPYFQRLRWIKQLGWSHYIFPGATHTRFAHALGAMHIMDKILRSIGKGVDDEKLYNLKTRDSKTMFHRKMRIAAMLHDIGTFPFSHSIEAGYIKYNRKQIALGKKITPANHEELGRHIITNTDFASGITHILKADGFDPNEIAQIINGHSDDPLANQLIHSDIDADRMDYLLRDSHYTGVKYGVFDVDYLIANMRVCKQGKNEVLAVNESALMAVEYFLICRYSWYTQIIHEGTAYQFDLLAERIAEFFIETGLAYSFEEIKNLVSKNPKAFFGFNDSYFTSKLHEALEHGVKGAHKISAMIEEWIEMLMFRIPMQQIKADPFEASLITSPVERSDRIEKIHNAVEWLRTKLDKVPTAWVVEDIPTKDVIFTKNSDALKRSNKTRLDQQSSVKIVDREGNVKLLIDVSNSLIRILAGYQNFTPRVYVGKNTYKYLQSKGSLKELEKMFGPQLKTKKPA
ncbi:MAG: HD domain-containing protein [Oligoflexia bacterium]|nr:HD domain-containing protein [Oligoflexia bacterium]